MLARTPVLGHPARTMPLQNRVQPTGDIIAHPARGTLTGNRGILHVADRQMGPALWKHKAWIACTLDWQGRKRALMTGRNWTELFFLDEAVALAAGHRPCAYCRRADYARWKEAWCAAHGEASAPEMDKRLHSARALPGARQLRRHQIADIASLPGGCFILRDGTPHLIWEAALWPYTPGGYGAPHRLDPGPGTLLTPPPTVEVLRAGYALQKPPTLPLQL